MTLEMDGPATAAPWEGTAAAGPRVALVVLGMHRSGTSALSGVLARLGCDVPATPMAPDAQNTKGFYESRLISSLNNVVLSSAGVSWDNWTGVDPAWFDSPRRAAFAEQACRLVEGEFGTSPLIVLKDPRVSLLVPLWFDVLRRVGYEVRIVFAYRSASEVAASLKLRNGFDPALGYLLWLRYVLEAEHASREVPRVFVGYDRLLSDWPAEISRIEAGLDLRLPRQSPLAREEVEDFLTPSMRHFAADAPGQRIAAASHPWLRDVHAVFDRWTRDGEDASDRGTLDRIRGELDGVSPVFDRLVRVAKRSVETEAALKTRLKEAETAIEQDKATAEADREALDRAEERLGDAKKRLDALEAGIDERDRANAALEDKIAALRIELERRGEVLLTYEQKNDDLNHALADLSKLQVGFQKASEEAARQKRESDAALLRATRAAESQKRQNDAALARANSRIDRIRNSRSFKLTAPLRRLKSLVAGKK